MCGFYRVSVINVGQYGHDNIELERWAVVTSQGDRVFGSI
ncbi:hypothetical protein AVDCRST_MAG92-4957 [uncultured Coleofasciculus sp.]|uniref:Uncharacterized protein n=1 Tax=uncultured Coleofasciculus sp. TaxID=1267456 RepID=A0A6J4KAA9_9CYAN|nr:hypothetical protein AVDCRST_MAG92-4957 [uncultured Coleofasciculus sp.]